MKLAYEKLKSVNQHLTLFLFQEEAIIYSDLSENLYLLNALGVYAWLLFEEGLAKEEVLALCVELKASNGKTTSAIERKDLPLLVEELSVLFKTAEIINAHADEEELWLKEIIFDTRVSEEIKGNNAYKILDSLFYFSLPNQEVKDLVLPILSQFKLEASDYKKIENTEALKVLSIKITEDKNNNYRITVNNYTFSWEIPVERLLSFFLDRLRKLALYSSAYFLAAHSAVMRKGGVCLMLPAVSYSGKSTLSAALVSNGYQYLSDEMAVIDKSFKARPVPLGLGLKSGSWQVLKDYLPELDAQEALERWDGVPIKYLPISYEVGMSALKLSEESKKVSHLVFPKYQKNAKASLQPLSIPQAIYQLYQAGYTQGKALSLTSLELILSWLENAPSYCFEFDDLDEAAQCLGALQ